MNDSFISIYPIKSAIYILVFSIFLQISGCIPLSAIFLGNPDHKDIDRFESEKLIPSQNCFEFIRPSISGKAEIKVNDWTRDIPFFRKINEMAADHPIRSLMIIQRDTIKYEYFDESQSHQSLHPSYSIAKSFTSALVGIAIDEGLINSENDEVVNYLPNLKGVLKNNPLTIHHLLNHTSGIKYKVAIDAVLYYGKDLQKAYPRIEFEHEPGKVQHYLNINVQLLGDIIEIATGMSPTQYLQKKIWNPLGMCHEGKWSTDKKDKQTKTYCCLGATTEDYAKFGRLFMNKGAFNGKQIISEEWVAKSLARDTTEGSSYNYNYCWHIGLKEYGDFMANGLYKQHIYVNPEKELIIVLLNNKDDKLKAERVNWCYVFRQIADQL